MTNTLTTAEIKRRGMAAIEESLRRGPVHIVKRNKLAAVVLSEEDYQRLIGGQSQTRPSMTALQWLLSQSAVGTRDKADIDTALGEERAW
ncbi:MAG: type II toxin-antitoxin system Phd/YefM family antitoxin [Nitrosomonas sp.]|nr:type II toxin-antitoxin system Phd/YefM family antitoxin [Nitrosomonas sp.]MDL1865277.1 type II toxin-antitoxin system Phd/YefM family antitoxin [Betaproteobacteria bacterium PRO5]